MEGVNRYDPSSNIAWNRTYLLRMSGKIFHPNKSGISGQSFEMFDIFVVIDREGLNKLREVFFETEDN